MIFELVASRCRFTELYVNINRILENHKILIRKIQSGTEKCD